MSKPNVKFLPIYHVMRALVRFGLHLYYRRLKIVGYEDVPKGVPLFFASNHQNAFMDALLLGGNTKGRQQPNYITRSDVFNPKTLSFLSTWKMLPIYRQRDGKDYLQKNEEMFHKYIDLLKNGDSIVIFPEGNHGRVRKLRVLRKGIGRIGFQAMEEMDGNFDDILMVPVGLNYSAHKNLRSDALVIFGEPIGIKKYYEQHKNKDRRALIDLRNDLAKGIQDEMIHIKSPEYYETIEGLRTISSEELLEQSPAPKKDQLARLRVEQNMIKKVEEGMANESIDGPSLKEDVETYFNGIEELGIRDHVVRTQPHGMPGLILQALGLLISFPAFAWGWLNHILVYNFAVRFTRKTFKDDHFHSSMMFIIAFFLFPLSYLLLAGIAWAIFGWQIALAYFLTLPLFGNFSLVYSRWFKKFRGKWRFQTALQGGNSTANSLVGLREKIMGVVRKAVKAGQPVMEGSQA
ncbi:MAG: 1-acyl-sn-glycerol-3-phosphate acyltransferase [Bacteroidota bacterium]